MENNKQSNLRDFDVLSKLGEGAFGQVFKVKRKVDGKQYALKKVKIGSMKQKERDNALNEIRILASYNEQFIIGYKEAFYDDVSGSLCIVMEFAQGGDILKQNQIHLKNRTKYKEDEIWRALAHMTKGLKSLHDKKIMHRDLKCANVFITVDNLYKLGDLNVSKVLKKDMAQTQTGTPYYASPEVWKDKPYGVKSDIWSLGCVLYQMAALRPPFVASDLQGLYKKVIAGIFERIPNNYSNDLAMMISSFLKVDPEKRPSTDQVLTSQVVRKHYDGQLMQPPQSAQQQEELLKTIKYNPKDLKGLRNFLPKANYEQDITQKQKLKIEQMKGGIQSCKNARKQPNIKEEIKNSIQSSDKRLTEYMEKKRIMQEMQREKQLKQLIEHKEQLSRKRERVLSACGIRPPPNLLQSPKMAIHSKNDLPKMPETNKITKKQEPKLNIGKMPPKPQQNINYKLPPKPISIAVEEVLQKNRNQGKNSAKKFDVPKNVNQRPPSSSGSNAGSQRTNRSNSVQKVIYPSWWG